MPKKYQNRSLSRSRSRSPVRNNKNYKRTPDNRKKYYIFTFKF